MILTLNLENTDILLGCFQGEKLLFSSRLSADRKRSRDEYAISLRDILALYGVHTADLQGAIIASVVPGLTAVLKEALFLLLGREPLVVGPGVKTGLNIRMDHPASVGSDLVASAVAAIAEYPVPLVAVDMGTATTLLAVNGEKAYVGAIIAPGVSASLDALAEHCDQLPRVAVEAPRDVLGKNTVDSIKSGLIYGTAAMLDGLIMGVEEQLGCECTVIATGHNAKAIIPHCRRKMLLDEHLVLKGLRRIYEKNQKK